VKLGPLEITWRMKMSQARYDGALVRGHLVAILGEDRAIRGMIARAARSEAKDAVDEVMELIGAANPHLEIRRPDRSRPFPPPEGAGAYRPAAVAAAARRAQDAIDTKENAQ
jgi:hypothetical protein